MVRIPEIALVSPAKLPYMGSPAIPPVAPAGPAELLCSIDASAVNDDRERPAIRQDPSRREFSGGVLDHPSAPPRADSRLLQFRQDRRRYRRSPVARSGNQAQLAR